MEKFFTKALNQVSKASQQTQITINHSKIYEKIIITFSLDLDFLNFRSNGQVYQIKTSCLMKPSYEGSLVKTIILQNSQQNQQGFIELTCLDINKMNILYQKLTRIISHKGFNDYFKVCKRLGRGNFATVYLVEHKFTGHKMAMKVFSKEGHKLQYKGQQSLENQIKTLKTLDHPNIIKFYGLYETQALLYVATQYISGGTLQQTIMRKFSHTGEKINKIFKSVLCGLAYLSQKNIMHRDIKPQNILYRDEDDNWVITDFGLAANVSKDFLNFGRCGTMGYIAPQIMNLTQTHENSQISKYNQSCDIYSFGIIAYTLIVGSLPFKVQSENFFDKKIVWVLFERQECKKIPSNIINFLKLLLEEDPKKRITAKEALRQSFFEDNTISKSLYEYNENRRKQRYQRILKIANN